MANAEKRRGRSSSTTTTTVEMGSPGPAFIGDAGEP
jgi:hypothetical protein